MRDLLAERSWQIARFVLGVLQMGGAALSLLLILRMGFTKLSLGVVMVTCLVTSISVVLFGARSSQGPIAMEKRKERSLPRSR
jgi:hypothetical protein